MGKLFRTRELLDKFPWLDRARMNVLGWICNHGSSFFDRSYNRLRVVSPEARPYILEGKPHILAIYHGSMISILGMKPRKKLTVLISESRDGEMIARGIGAMGFSVARGSSFRGAVKGALQLIEAANSGQNLAFMVDGPRGPRFEVKPGIVRMASMTGLPIIPVSHQSRHTMLTKSWDKWGATCWGSPEIFIFGPPVAVPPEVSAEELEKLRQQLESCMNELNFASQQFWPGVGEGQPETCRIIGY